jgi:PhnB protein
MPVGRAIGFPTIWKGRRYTGATQHWQGGESMDRNEQQGPSGGITPHLMIPGRRASEAIDFYVAAFGARELHRVPTDDGRIMHAHLAINGSSLMLNDDFPEYRGGEEAGAPGGVTLHLQVTDPDALWQQAIGAGASVTMPLEDQFWGDRYGQLQDPFGHRWSIGAPVKADQAAT